MDHASGADAAGTASPRPAPAVRSTARSHAQFVRLLAGCGLTPMQFLDQRPHRASPRFGRAARIVAVEPDERMRAVLAARCPEAEVLAGRGDDIPLQAASVDAVVISSAWHWLDPDLAVPEITR